MGAVKSKELLAKALTVFEKSVPSLIWEERQKVANEFPKEKIGFLDSLDQEFYKYEDNLQQLILKYAEAHRNDFGK